MQYGWILALALVLLPGFAGAADSREVSGVDLPRHVTVAGTELALNGAGVRTRFFFRVYVGALYTAEPVTSGASAITMDAPRRVHLAMLRDVDRETMVDALQEGLERTMSPAEQERHAGHIRAFRELFPGDFNEGDRGDIDAIPGEGVVVRMNGRELGRVDSDAFARFVLAIWLGDEPADDDVKAGMLQGGE
ncbi:chalcone isomerase family protein [Aquisalimonas lutea]|uniref:chalcone isomerase family protein n=1 Tax=Aquisalimonas lutea TaxID=1327750 RepID=UPI0025B43A75|nr:chalcone isomerase family protein [Aquisalimonas lutea]MDN3518612.1 chalcone isomerase family protein [Aquisalimonas lutea]